MIKKLLIVLLLGFTPLFALPSAAGAVDVFSKDVCNVDQKDGANAGAKDSSVCEDKKLGGGNPLYGPRGILTTLINLLSLIVGVIALIVILLAGLKFITSGNNPQDVTNARERVIYACIALVIAVMAQAAVRFVIGKVAS